MNPARRELLQMAGALVVVVMLVFAFDWVLKGMDDSRERRASQMYGRAYRIVYDEVLDALTDTLSAEARDQETLEEAMARRDRPKAKRDSARADEATERLMERIQGDSEFLEWLKLSQPGQ